MALEDFCLLSGILFLLIYAVTIATSLTIIIERRKHDLAMNRIRCPAKRKVF